MTTLTPVEHALLPCDAHTRIQTVRASETATSTVNEVELLNVGCTVAGDQELPPSTEKECQLAAVKLVPVSVTGWDTVPTTNVDG